MNNTNRVKKLHISECSSSVVENSILVTGSARSGTTIMGKLIHSLANVEYVFEPPMLFSLYAMMNKLPKDQWQLLYETYLYEEFLVNSLAGRSLNCNKADDSSIYRVKGEKEINDRLSASRCKSDIERYCEQYTVAYKLPDIIPFVPKIIEFYPNMRVIVMLRDGVGVINSLIKKKWFSNEGLESSLTWPFRVCRGVHVPFWVKDGDDELWVELSEIDRVAYYYIRVNENIECIDNCIEVRYSELLQQPYDVLEKIAAQLDMNFGVMTNSLISSIKLTNIERDIRIIENVSLEFREKVIYYSDYSVNSS